MLDTLQFQDEELNLMNVSRQDIIDSLTLEDVYNFLESLGVTEIQVNEDKGYIVCPTICHNPINEASSMKLYWYHDNKIFRCYTECNEAMSIFTLYQKYMALNYYPVSLEDAVDYVKRSLKHLIVMKPREKRKQFDANRYKFTARIPQLESYNEHILDCFVHGYRREWLNDGILPRAMDKFGILYSIENDSVIIPQRDIKGRLIGVRERVFQDWQMEYGKYHPIKKGGITYSYSESFTLYGIYEHKKAIQKRRAAILVEAEKSVLLDDGFYGDNAIAVALCTSHTNKYHISLLTDILGVNEIVLALDKEYIDGQGWRDPKAYKYRAALEKICNDYKGHATFSYIWDYENLLNEKDSPYDKGKEVFEYLYKHRVKVK